MEESRKKEVVDNLKYIAQSINEEELTMFKLVSEYTKNHNNQELIGGEWVRENIPEFADLE